MDNLRWKLILIGVVTVVFGAVGVYPQVAPRFGVNGPKWLMDRALKLGLDLKGGVHLVGEDRIGHTPKDETLNLKIGNAFDVVCERNQVDFEKIGGMTWELEYEITLRNHKAIPIVVEVNEPIGGTWRMLQSSHEWTKTAAWASRFTVPVAADGTAVLKYRVRVSY